MRSPTMRKHLLFVIILLLVPFSAHAQKRAFTIEDLYRVKSIADVHVSPDGKSIIYAVATSDLARAKRVSHIWMMNMDGGSPRQLTSDEKGESSPIFSPDGKWILYISSKDGSPQIYLMPTGGGEGNKLPSTSTGGFDPLWAPDRKWVALSLDVSPACGGDQRCKPKIPATWSK